QAPPPLRPHRTHHAADHLPRPLRIGVRQRRAVDRRGTKTVEPGLVAGHAGDDLAQARRTAQLAKQQSNEVPLRIQFARQSVGTVLLHKLLKSMPRHVLQEAMKYAILMPHGAVSLPCLERCPTLKTQKNPRHAPCPLKSNRTAVGSSRPSRLGTHAIALLSGITGTSPVMTAHDK